MGIRKRAPATLAGAASAAAPLLATPPASVAALFPTPGSVFTDGLQLPRLVVFDLDYTLWPFWVDTHVSGPVRAVDGSSSSSSRNSKAKVSSGAAAATAAAPTTAVVDKFGETYAFYSDVPAILQALPAAGVCMGVASRTSAPDLARDVLRLLQVPQAPPQAASQTAAGAAAGGGDAGSSGAAPGYRRALDVFAGGLEIYPTTKLRHMEALQRRTGLAYEDFLFFDDESRNRNVETLGVTMCLVRDGVCWSEIERGVRQWRTRRGYGASQGREAAAAAADNDDDDDDDDDY